MNIGLISHQCHLNKDNGVFILYTAPLSLGLMFMGYITLYLHHLCLLRNNL